MSKRCQKCNAILDDTANFCSACGTRQNPQDDEQTGLLVDEEETGLLNEEDQETGELNPEDAYFGRPEYKSAPPFNPATPPVTAPLDERQFYYMYASKNTKGLSTALIVICFITAAISLVSLLFGNFLSFVDFAYYIVFAFLMLFKKNWVFPLAVTIYSGVFSLFGLLVSGIASGIVVLVIGIMCVIRLRKVNGAYEIYKKTRQLPNTQL